MLTGSYVVVVAVHFGLNECMQVWELRRVIFLTSLTAVFFASFAQLNYSLPFGFFLLRQLALCLVEQHCGAISVVNAADVFCKGILCLCDVGICHFLGLLAFGSRFDLFDLRCPFINLI
jgi:hypothetical protein